MMVRAPVGRRRLIVGGAAIVLLAGTVFGALALAGRGITGSITGVSTTPSARPAAAASSAPGTTGRASASTSASAAASAPGRFKGAGWSITLPADPALRHSSFGTAELWLAGDGTALRGVFAGPLDLAGAAPTLDVATERLRAELASIPGGTGVSQAEAATLPAGPARWVTATVGTSRFVAWSIVAGGAAWRVMVVGYPDETAAGVAASFAAP